MTPSGGTPLDIDVIYTPLKSEFTCNGLQFRRWHYRSIFIRLAAVGSRNRKITHNSAKIWPYSSSRSSKVIDLDVNRKRICDFLVVTNYNFGRISYLSRLTLKARKWLIFPTAPLFDASARGEPLTIFGWNLPHKNYRDGATVRWCFVFVILTSTVFVRSTRVTDGRTGDSIIAR